MFRVRCNQGGLFLTAELMVRDEHAGQLSADYAMPALHKRHRFQPIEDLVHALDKIASGATAA